MKLFALFDETGKCISIMATTDESLLIPSEYEEVTDPEEQRLCRTGKARKLITDEGKRLIVQTK